MRLQALLRAPVCPGVMTRARNLTTVVRFRCGGHRIQAGLRPRPSVPRCAGGPLFVTPAPHLTGRGSTRWVDTGSRFRDFLDTGPTHEARALIHPERELGR